MLPKPAVHEAYAILTSPYKRAAYDTFVDWSGWVPGVRYTLAEWPKLYAPLEAHRAQHPTQPFPLWTLTMALAGAATLDPAEETALLAELDALAGPAADAAPVDAAGVAVDAAAFPDAPTATPETAVPAEAAAAPERVAVPA